MSQANKVNITLFYHAFSIILIWTFSKAKNVCIRVQRSMKLQKKENTQRKYLDILNEWVNVWQYMPSSFSHDPSPLCLEQPVGPRGKVNWHKACCSRRTSRKLILLPRNKIFESPGWDRWRKRAEVPPIASHGCSDLSKVKYKETVTADRTSLDVYWKPIQQAFPLFQWDIS